MFLNFFQWEISEMRGQTGVKFCTVVSTRPIFIMSVQNFGGLSQINFRGQKHAKFSPISGNFEVGSEYLWNGWRYLQSDKYFIYRDFSCIRQNKSDEVWSSNLGDLDVKSYSPKAPLSEDYISAPRGCCNSTFLHTLENHQVLLVHPPPGMGPPLQLFSKGSQKLA